MLAFLISGRFLPFYPSFPFPDDCPERPVLCDLSLVYCPRCHVPLVTSLMSCPRRPASIVLPQLFCPRWTVPGGHGCAVAAVLFWCLVSSVLSRLPCPGCLLGCCAIAVLCSKFLRYSKPSVKRYF
jgi:hypothetical protein